MSDSESYRSGSESPTLEDLAFLDDAVEVVVDCCGDTDAGAIDPSNIIAEGRRRRTAPNRWRHPDEALVNRNFCRDNNIEVTEMIDILNGENEEVEILLSECSSDYVPSDDDDDDDDVEEYISDDEDINLAPPPLKQAKFM
jgi:hypothetical protein